MSEKIKKVVIIIWPGFFPMLPEMMNPSLKVNQNNTTEYEYTATIVFDSIRIAFPDSIIKVICNGDVSDKLKKILLEKTKEIEGTLIMRENTLSHDEILRKIISSHSFSTDSISIVDSDIIFWDRFDDVSDLLYEGVFVPSYEECYSTHSEEKKVFIHSNVHAAFLKIKNPKLLWEKISTIESKNPHLDVFKPITINRFEKWEHYDTMSMLYSIFSSEIRKFDKNDLNKYVHLFAANRFDFDSYMFLENNLRSLELSKLYKKIHFYVKNKDYEKLKKLWKLYKQFKY